VHDAHPAAANFFNDPVVGDGLVDHGALLWYEAECGKSMKTSELTKPSKESFHSTSIEKAGNRS
ncbi:MAG: hypothetical protein ACM3JB_25305, partial [Acidobacteriaceae bacterium]